LDAAKTDGTSTVEANNRSKPVAPNQVPPSVQPSDVPLSNTDLEEQLNNEASNLQVNIFIPLISLFVIAYHMNE
jgi:hypothetical protein